jgi:hypothetical protein
MKKFQTIEELNEYIKKEYACENIEDLLKDYERVLDILSKIAYLANQLIKQIILLN